MGKGVKDKETFRMLGLSLAKANDYQGTANALAAAVSLGATDKDVFEQLGTAHYFLKDYKSSIESLSRAI
ncbi:MAG: hypothetical protein ACKOC0_02045, partial [Cytophagales bacterium]